MSKCVPKEFVPVSTPYNSPQLSNPIENKAYRVASHFCYGSSGTSVMGTLDTPVRIVVSVRAVNAAFLCIEGANSCSGGTYCYPNLVLGLFVSLRWWSTRGRPAQRSVDAWETIHFAMSWEILYLLHEACTPKRIRNGFPHICASRPRLTSIDRKICEDL